LKPTSRNHTNPKAELYCHSTRPQVANSGMTSGNKGQLRDKQIGVTQFVE